MYFCVSLTILFVQKSILHIIKIKINYVWWINIKISRSTLYYLWNFPSTWPGRVILIDMMVGGAIFKHVTMCHHVYRSTTHSLYSYTLNILHHHIKKFSEKHFKHIRNKFQ